MENHQDDKLEQNETAAQETKSCCNELQDVKNRYIYLTAEFDNYRKRTEKEKKQLIEYGEDFVLKDFLGIVDNFERAFHRLESQTISDELRSQFEGFKLILKSMHNLLSKFAVKQVETKEFDPELHEALAQVQSDKHKSGEIVEIYEKGYTRKDQVLRPAKVSVAK